MTRIDFYVLADETEDAALRFACVLSARARRDQLPVHIHTQTRDHAERLDRLMWDYPRHRFCPHVLLDEDANATQAPVHIGWEQPNLKEGVLINLSLAVPEFFGRFDRVAEVVVNETKASGRERYAHYRSRGCPLNHHELTDWEQMH